MQMLQPVQTTEKQTVLIKQIQFQLKQLQKQVSQVQRKTISRAVRCIVASKP